MTQKNLKRPRIGILQPAYCQALNVAYSRRVYFWQGNKRIRGGGTTISISILYGSQFAVARIASFNSIGIFLVIKSSLSSLFVCQVGTTLRALGLCPAQAQVHALTQHLAKGRYQVTVIDALQLLSLCYCGIILYIILYTVLHIHSLAMATANKLSFT